MVTDTMHGALKSDERAYDWYDCSAAVAIAAAKYKVASQEAEILYEPDTLHE